MNLAIHPPVQELIYHNFFVNNSRMNCILLIYGSFLLFLHVCWAFVSEDFSTILCLMFHDHHNWGKKFSRLLITLLILINWFYFSIVVFVYYNYLKHFLISLKVTSSVVWRHTCIKMSSKLDYIMFKIYKSKRNRELHFILSLSLTNKLQSSFKAKL